MNTPELIALSKTLANIAEGAALSVKDLLIEGFNSDKTIDEKAGFYDVVTEYDGKSEEMIIDYIFEHYPDSTILGEEGGAKGNGKVHWHIDPIDGTMNFAEGIPFFCVSIGVAIDEQMVAGVVLDPMRDELFSASLEGSFCNGKPIKAGNARIDKEAIIITSYPHIKSKVFDNDGEFYFNITREFRSIRRMGSSALELAYVAAGRADVVMATQTCPWDIAAGMCLVEQAGGKYIPIHKPEPITSWPPCQYIATGPDFELEQSILRDFL